MVSGILDSTRVLYLLIQWDLAKISRKVIFVAMRSTWFVIQVLFFGYIMANMVNASYAGLDVDSYYKFYLFGVYTSILFAITASRAYDIAEEFEEGIIEYQLSLPISRRILALGRAIGSGIASFIFTTPMLLVVIALTGEKDPIAIALSTLSALIFSIAISGFILSITLSIRSSDTTDIIMGVLDAILVRLSTVFYPAVFLKSVTPYYYVALINPVSHAADLLRIFYSFEEFKSVIISHPITMLSYIVGLFAGFTALAMYIVEKKNDARWKVANLIVREAAKRGYGIVLERLGKQSTRNMVNKIRDEQLRHRIYQASFKGIQRAIEEKAREYGVPLVYVDPRNTSTTCPIHRAKIHYSSRSRIGNCSVGGETWHRDVVACWNLLLRALGGGGSNAPSRPRLSLDGGCVPFNPTATHEPTLAPRSAWAKWKTLDTNEHK